VPAGSVAANAPSAPVVVTCRTVPAVIVTSAAGIGAPLASVTTPDTLDGACNSTKARSQGIMRLDSR
jgi:hypothetical protein